MRKNKIEIGGHKVRDRHDLHTRINWSAEKEVDYCHVVNGIIVSRSRKQAKVRKFEKRQLNKQVRRNKDYDDTIVIRKGLDWIIA